MINVAKQWIVGGLLISMLPTLAHSAETVRLAQNLAPISGLVIIAQEQHFFAKNGLDVQISNFSNGRQALETVLSNGADVATTAEAPITAAALANQKIALLARMEYSDDKTLTRSAAHISSLADLKGKRIGFSAGTGSEIYTSVLLKQARLTPSEVQLVNLPPQDMPAALAAGSIDAYDSWEPYIANGKKVLGSGAQELDTKGIYAETFNLVVQQAYLKSHPTTVVAFLRAVVEAQAWAKANQDEAITTIARATHMNREDLVATWKNFVFDVVLDQRTLDTLNTHAQWRLATGNAPDGATLPDFRSIIFSAPLAQVDATRVTLPASAN